MSDQASWVYAVLPGETSALPTGLTGVMAEPPRLVRDSGLAAVVGSVPAAEVTEARLAERLADADWLEQVVRAHHEVVSTCFARQPTVPFRLATVYHNDGRVAELLRDQSARLREALDTVTGRAEWGVQASPVAPDPGDEAGPGDDGAHPPAERSGTEYLLHRRARRARQQQARADAAVAAQQLDAALLPFAMAIHRSPPPTRSPDGQPEPVVLNSAYLVDDDHAKEFADTVHSAVAGLPQLRVRMTGPWPAYSFVTVAGGGE
ncbi:GvpL/GvpF family gas vesicle protein [Natronosporangium hydrolyticum]|uniref:GvpL/GvpF family gas vesicle protein n=1 Tax=Natronosporangium hydrolyticum TaxID=2811111 RepID=A0A895YCH6_9ACTN|nr:GvpL/GvpF family gas vesicle protein [Natronosporangium hydrolyticum]QSB15191.1 GvpL/GvpF family gas vesicle protein [Natronosporangium hydrolyticum]